MPATVAQIAVDQAAFHFDRLYSYRLTEEAGGVRRGCRVLVPFGGGNRTRPGDCGLPGNRPGRGYA